MKGPSANRVMFRKLLIVALAMFGFGYALVPFYQAICRVTGINSLQQKADAPANSQVDASRWITVQFDANTGPKLPWDFQPVQRSVRIHPGEFTQIQYEVRNKTDDPVTGQAFPSYGPQQAALYFKKLECFCFNRQALAPREVRRMPVVFVVEAGLPRDIDTITLSYTFFQVEGGGSVAAGKDGRG